MLKMNKVKAIKAKTVSLFPMMKFNNHTPTMIMEANRKRRKRNRRIKKKRRKRKKREEIATTRAYLRMTFK